MIKTNEKNKINNLPYLAHNFIYEYKGLYETIIFCKQCGHVAFNSKFNYSENERQQGKAKDPCTRSISHIDLEVTETLDNKIPTNKKTSLYT